MTGLFSTARRRWMRFWFEPAPPTCLGVSRLLFFLALAAFYIPHDFSAWASVSPDFYQPIWLFERFRIPVFGPAGLVPLQIAWKVSLVRACLGPFRPCTSAAVAVVGAYLSGLPHRHGPGSAPDPAGGEEAHRFPQPLADQR